MQRRDFLSLMGGATTLALARPTASVAAPATTSVYMKGLILGSFEDPNVFRFGFPSAAGHDKSLTVVTSDGKRRARALKKSVQFDGIAGASSAPPFVIPELVRMKEFYGDGVRSTIESCPTVVSIPYSAIRSIKTHELSDDRYTFVRVDSGLEIATFRPRRVAASLKIDLSSDAVLHIDRDIIPVQTTRELHFEHMPSKTAAASADPFADHFHHYLEYVQRPANSRFDVMPRKLGGSQPAVRPRVGNNFAMYWPYIFCFVAAL